MRYSKRHAHLQGHAMRYAILPALVICTTALAEPPTSPRGTEVDKKDDRATQAYQIVRKAVAGYTVRGDSDQGLLKPEPEPILRFSNPVVGSVYGSVFVWTEKGRPEVLASVFKWYSPARHVGVEFNSLSLGLVTAVREGKQVWHPVRPGVAPEPIAGAPAPADSPAGRLRQMRSLADQFSATETNEANVTHDLRLLTKPIYRYASTAGNPLDGALFVLVQGTDPEAVLLIEARHAGGEKCSWHAVLARMTYQALHVSHKGREVWSAPLIRWDVANSPFYDPREPYVSFVFRPGEGANPPLNAEDSFKSEPIPPQP